MRFLSALSLLALLLTACGNTSTTTATERPPAAAPPSATRSATPQSAAPATPAVIQVDATAALPDCAPAVEQPFQLPAPFAPSFPVPGGLKWYRLVPLRNDPAHPEVQMVGIAPLGLTESVQFLRSGLLQAGYQVAQVDAEIDESDAQFNGNGWTGSYRVKAIPGCAQATTWTIRVLKI